MSEAILEYLEAKDVAPPEAKITSPAVKLTQAIIDSLPTKPYDYQIREITVPSLRVRVRKDSGNKIFEIHKKVNGRPTTAPICRNGQAPYSKGDESVLVRARAMIAEMDRGVTPARKKLEARAAAVKEAREALTLQEACDNYINAKDRAKNTTKGYERFRDNHLIGLHRYQLATITEDDVEELFDEITDETGPVAANNVLRFFRAVWKHHRRRYGLGDSPTIIFTAEGDNIKSWNAESRRTRYVHREELKPWWEATERLRKEYVGDGELAADYLQFAMLTGLRRREITGLKWEDINRRRKTFLIAENKSKRPYAVPLTQDLVDILDRREGEPRPFNIEEPKRFITQVAEWSQVPFSSHDLRRTYLSHATAVGIPMSVQKALVNHSRKSDVTDGYIQIDEDVMREAMDKIQTYILSHAGQIKTVTPIRGASNA
jgi:integrase